MSWKHWDKRRSLRCCQLSMITGRRCGLRILGDRAVCHRPKELPKRRSGGDSMNEMLTPPGYEQTKEKLAELERRLGEIEKRTDLEPEHLASVRRSYRMVMRELLREIKLYEAKHPTQKGL